MLKRVAFIFAFALAGLVGMVSISVESSISTTYAQNVNATERSLSASPFEIQSPGANEVFTWQGLSSSLPRQLPGEEPQGQTAIILPPRDDDAVYSGMLDYFSSRPIDVIAWNVISPNNETAIPEEFGNLDDYVITGDETVVFTPLDSGTSGSVPFNANAIELVSATGDDGDGGNEGEPFIVSYAIRAFPAPFEIVNNLDSISTFNASSTEVESTAEDEEGEEEQG